MYAGGHWRAYHTAATCPLHDVRFRVLQVVAGCFSVLQCGKHTTRMQLAHCMTSDSWFCNVLQCVAVCCSVESIAHGCHVPTLHDVRFSVLQGDATGCRVLQGVAVFRAGCCSVQQQMRQQSMGWLRLVGFLKL